MFVEILTLFYLGMILYPIIIVLSYLNFLAHKPQKPGKVAIIGSGIAGCASAWSLRKAGWDVTIYETKDVVGGNAKVHTWDNFDDKPQTGLSVLAWPVHKFHNYNKLIDEFQIETQAVKLPFFSLDSKGEVVAHGLDNEIRAKFVTDFEKWEKMNAFIKKVNCFLSGADGSLYNMSYINPFNILPLKTVSKLFGISSEFWAKVVEPVYSSTFLSKHLEYIPAVVGPTISDIVPLSGIPNLVSWKKTSQQVFDKLIDGCHIKTSTDVTRVIRRGASSDVVDNKGKTNSYDNVIFACPPDVALKMIEKPTWLQKLLLANVSYPETETTFEEGIIHNDPTVLPKEYRADLLSKFANFIYITYEPNGDTNIENTFLLSSWVPSVQQRKEQDDTPMMITYNTKKKIANPRGIVTNKHAHPALSLRNLAIGALMRFCQGIDGNFFCSSFTTPGNGHDMSLLSGFAVARALGAEYPFQADHRCSSDFEKLCSIMGVHVAEK